MKNNRVETFIKNPKKAFFTLALPVVITMSVQTLYNIVDTAFVGRLGAEAIAALSFSFPLFFLMIAINAGIGAGMSSRIARYLGEKKKEQAENTAMHGIFISLIFALIIFTTGNTLIDSMFLLFGAQGHTLELAKEYMSVIFIGFLFMFPAFVMSQIFSSQGDTKTPMRVQISSLILNIILDPIFIYVFGLGVRGAAIATAISFSLSLILFSYFTRTRSYLNISLHSFKFSPELVKEIFRIGAPASLMMLLLSVYVIFINRFMAFFGTEYVAAFGLASRLESVAIMPIVAFGIATLTLVGMFYGAKRYDLVKNISWYGIKKIAMITSIIGLVFFAIPSLFLRIFTPDVTLLRLSSAYLRIDVFTFPLMAVGMLIARIMQGLGTGIPGLVINGVRIFLVAIPLAYLFVFKLGLGYLWIAFALVIGGVVSNIIAITWLKLKFRELS